MFILIKTIDNNTEILGKYMNHEEAFNAMNEDWASVLRVEGIAKDFNISTFVKENKIEAYCMQFPFHSDCCIFSYNAMIEGAKQNFDWMIREIPGGTTSDEVIIEDTLVLTKNGKYLVSCSKSASGKIVIPDGVEIIGEGAFWRCKNITSIEIPDSVICINQSAFSRCMSLKDIQLPQNLKKLGDGAFFLCESLKTIELPSSLESIGNGVFMRCSNLLSAKLPEGITKIPHSMFVNCENLEEVNIPDTVKHIESEAFKDTKILLSQKEDVKYVGKWAVDCNMLAKEAFIKPGTVGIAVKAFEKNNIKSIIIPDGVTMINGWAFANPRITSVSLPSSIKTIGNDAFFGFNPIKVEIRDEIRSITTHKNNFVVIKTNSGRIECCDSFSYRSEVIYASKRKKNTLKKKKYN